MNHLTEPGVKNYFIESFKECKQNKMNYYTKVLNITLFGVFCIAVASFLYFKKKNKLTVGEQKKKKEEDRLYIVNKIKTLHVDKQLITNLPYTFA